MFFPRRCLENWCHFKVFATAESALQMDKSLQHQLWTSWFIFLFEYQKLCKHIILSLHWRNTRQGAGEDEIKRSLGWECRPTIRALLLLEGEKQVSQFLLYSSSSIWNMKQRKKNTESKAQFYTLNLSSIAYVHISEDCTLKIFFATAYMKMTTKSLCSIDRWSCLFS